MRTLTQITLLAASLTLAASYALDTHAHAKAGDDDVVDKALLKIKIPRKDKKPLVHGHMAEIGTEAVFTLNDEGTKHVVSIEFDKKSESQFNLTVSLKTNGRKVAGGKKTAKARAWTGFKGKGGKVAVSILIDPDAKRADGLGIIDTDDPIEGAPPK